MNIPVNRIAEHGIITDLPYSEIALNAWTAGRNVRFRNGSVQKFSGHVPVYDGALNPAYFLLPVATGGNFFWVYAGQDVVGATDGATHADISQAGGYDTDLNVGWTGTVIEGVVVLNNFDSVPQFWVPDLGNDLADLSNWGATHRCKAMRSLKRYLVALNILKGSDSYPHMIKWSHAAAAGALPSSWDETDETVDAGEWVLSSEGGELIDGVPLRDDLILYKEYQTWLMQYIGGVDVFRFIKRFDSIGMLSRRSAIEFFSGKHLVLTGDDLVLHDGQQAQSVLQEKSRSLISGRIDSNNYHRSFVALNYNANEVWACFPESGADLATLAVVWNWKNNTVGLRDLPNAGFISSGVVDPTDPTEIWSGAVGTWDTDTAAWGDRAYDPAQRKMLMSIPADSTLQIPDTTQQFDGVNMTSYVEKRNIGFPLKADVPDYTTEKLVRGIYPRISGTAGGVVNVYLGSQQRIDQEPTWSTAFPFVIGSTEYCDFVGGCEAAKLHSLKFESTGDVAWQLLGYDADVVPAGEHGGR